MGLFILNFLYDFNILIRFLRKIKVEIKFLYICSKISYANEKCYSRLLCEFKIKYFYS